MSDDIDYRMKYLALVTELRTWLSSAQRQPGPYAIAGVRRILDRSEGVVADDVGDE